MFKKCVFMTALAFLLSFATACAAQSGHRTAVAASQIEFETITPKALEPPKPSISPTPLASADAPEVSGSLSKQIDYAAVRPYEVGQIMIIMYHGIIDGDGKDVYNRSVPDFKNDLQTMYDKGYRVLSLRDWRDNNITVQAGFTPVVLTFDDGKKTSFSLTQKDGVLQPTENCAVDIMTEFSQDHPDFGNTASFFINGNAEAFKGDGTMKERFQYLLEHGYEIGNHTYSHTTMRKLNADSVQEEIGKIDLLIREHVSAYIPYAFSYPYGERPQPHLRQYVTDGVWESHTYHYDFGLREGQSGAASAPNRVGFDPLDVPRVRGSDRDPTDLGWSIRFFDENPQMRYISDGNPDRIAVPHEFAENVNKDSLAGKELFLYDTTGKQVYE